MSRKSYLRDAFRLTAALVVVLIVVFAPYVFSLRALLASDQEASSIFPSGATTAVPTETRTLDPGAAAWFSEPALATAHRLEFASHGGPFWNPFVGYGTPFAATMQPQPFYPLSFAESLHASPYTYTLYILARLLLAGIGAALFVRLFVGSIGAFAAGASAMLTGYYLLYINMPHLSVEVLLPGAFWAVELAVRRFSPARIATLAVVTGSVLLGGMPETATLTLGVVSAYALFRMWNTYARPGLPLRTVGVIAGAVLGLGIGSIVVLPFLELFRHSFDVHQSHNTGGSLQGLRVDGAPFDGMLSELLPRVFGPPYHNITQNYAGFSGARGFFGVTAFTLGLLAIVRAFGATRSAVMRGPTFFFAVLAVMCALKRYGSPIVNWFGSIPVSQLINYPKYLEFVLGFAVAVLCGFGVDVIRRGAAKSSVVTITGVMAFGIFTALFMRTHGEVAAELAHAAFYYGSIIGGLAALIIAITLAYLATLSVKFRRPAASLLAGLVVLEVAASYIVPTFWLGPAPNTQVNPYAGAPYVTYLQNVTKPEDTRFLGIGGLLYPNWAGNFGLYDVRSLDAMYVEDYMHFLDAFLVVGTPPIADDLYDRFTGSRTLPLGTSRGRKWLTLSSIAFVASPGPITVPENPDGFLTALWAQVEPTVPAPFRPAIKLETASIDGVAENVLFEHAPYSNILFKVHVPTTKPQVVADLSLMPAVWHDSVCGEGVKFRLSAEQDGREVGAVERYIDPKHRTIDQHWKPIRLNLTRFAGHEIELRFATSLGLGQDACAAWAIWGEPRFAAPGQTGPLTKSMPSHFTRTYHGDADVYRYDDPLPRAQLYHDIVTVPSQDLALKKLLDDSTDVHRRAIVTGSAGSATVEPLSTRRRETVAVQSMEPTQVRVDVTVASCALLMLNDTFYPGWNVSIDGRNATILRTDYLFRGVIVPTGHHMVEFRYESGTVKLGVTVASVSLVIVLLLFGLAWQMQRRVARQTGDTEHGAKQ